MNSKAKVLIEKNLRVFASSYYYCFISCFFKKILTLVCFAQAAKQTNKGSISYSKCILKLGDLCGFALRLAQGLELVETAREICVSVVSVFGCGFAALSKSKNSLGMPNRLSLIVFALFVVSTATAEKLSYRQQDDGQYLIFIENAQSQPQQYTVELLSFDKDKPVAIVEAFQASLMKGILEAKFSPKSLPDGLYYFDLKQDGVSVDVAKPTQLIWDNEYLTQTVQVDWEKSQLRWQPPNSCLARIVAVLPSGMMMDVVSGWKFYGAEEQVLTYDFIGDDSRDLRMQPNLSIFAQYITLPLNTFVCGQPDFGAYDSAQLFRKLEIPNTPLYFELSTNADMPEDGSDVYLGSENTSITVKLSDETAERLSGKRFEVLIYLDGEFIHEEAQGTSPYTYHLPKFTSNDRPQAISVNILDYLGNWGTQTLIFQFIQSNETKGHATH